MSTPDPITKTDAATDFTARQSRTAQLGSLIALAFSGLALAVGAYQTRLMQTQARASVWPYLVIDYHYRTPESPNPGYALRVENNGVGPAVVRSVHVSVDGKPIQHWVQAIELLHEKEFPAVASAMFSGLRGAVIPPSTNRETAIAAFETDNDKVAAAFRDAQSRINVDICYCSIYDDCWTAHWETAKHEATPTCDSREPQFDY
jgi:hypothetical protein